MSAVAAGEQGLRWHFPVDLGWRNFVFAFRTALAGVAALAISFWLSLQDPQWSIVTVCLLAQSTTGGVLAKGAYRAAGTVVGALWGLIVVSLYAEAPAPLVLSMVLWLGLCIYGAARSRNFVSYGFLLAGYSALLVGFEGATKPMSAWLIAVDRTTEILVGIACSAVASVLIMPRNAGEVLRQSLARTFAGLASFAAAAMRPTTPAESIIAERRQLVAEVVTFDALRSYTRFESADMRVDDMALRRVGREFLLSMAAARGLFFRLEDFRKGGGGAVLERLMPVLATTSASLERIAADPSAVADPHRTRGELLAVRRTLGQAAEALAGMAGKAPFEFLANGLLVVDRAEDVLHGLSMVMVSEAATLQAQARGRRRRIPDPPANRVSAFVQAVRAALTLLIVSVFWAATTWTSGFWAITGLIVMMLVLVNQEKPAPIGWSCLAAVACALIFAYAAMVFVLPRLEGYQSLALFLIIALLPSGLLAGTPRFAAVGLFLGAFFAAEVATGNVFKPDAQVYANNAVGLLLGMAATLIVTTGLLPDDPPAARRRAWARILRTLPNAARGGQPMRAVSGEIVAQLSGLVDRLDLRKEGDETFLRGALGAASTSIELWRLQDRKDEPQMPQAERKAVGLCLDRVATAFGRLPERGADRPAILADIADAGATARGALAAISLEPGSPAIRPVLHAAVALRFIDDIQRRDRNFYLGAFEGH